MTKVEVVGGRLKVTKTAKNNNGKPPKYPYPADQYQALLKLAKASGVDTGITKAQSTKAVNLVVKAALDAFIQAQAEQKEPKKQ